MVDNDFALVHHDLKERRIISLDPALHMNKTFCSQIGNAFRVAVVTSTVTTPRLACSGALVAEMRNRRYENSFCAIQPPATG